MASTSPLSRQKVLTLQIHCQQILFFSGYTQKCPGESSMSKLQANIRPDLLRIKPTQICLFVLISLLGEQLTKRETEAPKKNIIKKKKRIKELFSNLSLGFVCPFYFELFYVYYEWNTFIHIVFICSIIFCWVIFKSDMIELSTHVQYFNGNWWKKITT